MSSFTCEMSVFAIDLSIFLAGNNGTYRTICTSWTHMKETKVGVAQWFYLVKVCRLRLELFYKQLKVYKLFIWSLYFFYRIFYLYPKVINYALFWCYCICSFDNFAQNSFFSSTRIKIKFRRRKSVISVRYLCNQFWAYVLHNTHEMNDR